MSAPPLLERERELAVIDERLAEAVAGRGGLVLIEGPAGIGKSALAARARELALARGMAVAAARGSSSSARTRSASCASCSSGACAR